MRASQSQYFSPPDARSQSGRWTSQTRSHAQGLVEGQHVPALVLVSSSKSAVLVALVDDTPGIWRSNLLATFSASASFFLMAESYAEVSPAWRQNPAAAGADALTTAAGLAAGLGLSASFGEASGIGASDGGDGFVASLRLLSSASQPYLAATHRWLESGELHDPAGELFSGADRSTV